MPTIKYRSIRRLSELKPGDHIRVRAGGSGFSSVSSHSTSQSSSRSGRPSGSKRAITHHLMVVRVIDSETIEVIHKTKDCGVRQERKRYKPEAITVLEYESKYTGDCAVKRAQQLPDEKYSLLKSNCEHFVFEARTGEKQSEQIEDTAVGGVVGGGAGALAGGGAGAGIGALIGGILGSVIPGPGNLAGAAIGGLIGGGAGAAVGAGGGAAGGSFVGLKTCNKDTQ